MKASIYLLLMILTGTKGYSQSQYLSINTTSNSAYKTPVFYTTSGDNTLDSIVHREMDYLSSILLVSPTLYFYKSCGEDLTLDAFKLIPKVDEHNIYFDIETPCDLEAGSNFKADVIIRLSKQFAITLVEKYKLELTSKQEEQFKDYITGYYVVKRCNFLNDIDQKDVYKTLFKSSLLINSSSSDALSLRQGYDDSKKAIQRHIKVTVRDLIYQSMQLLAEQ